MSEHGRNPNEVASVLERRLDRRALLRVGATGAAGLGVAGVLGARNAGRTRAA